LVSSRRIIGLKIKPRANKTRKASQNPNFGAPNHGAKIRFHVYMTTNAPTAQNAKTIARATMTAKTFSI